MSRMGMEARATSERPRPVAPTPAPSQTGCTISCGRRSVSPAIAASRGLRHENGAGSFYEKKGDTEMSSSAIFRPASSSGGGGSNGQAPPEKPRGKDSHIGLRFWIQLGQIEIAG